MLLAWLLPKIGHKKNRSSWRIVVLFSTLPLLLIAALRYDVGQDYMYTYVPYFLRVQTGTVSEMLEPVFHLINQVVVWLNGSYVWVFAICAALFLWFLSSQIFLDSPYPVLSVFLVVGMSYYFIFLNAMRQLVGCAILVYSIRYIQRRDFWRFLFCSALASGFHMSCALFLPMYLLGRARLKPIVVTGIALVVLLVSGPIVEGILAIILRSGYRDYISSAFDTGEKGYVILFINVLVTLLALWKSRDDQKYKLYFNMQVIAMLLASFSGKIVLIERARWIFGLPSVILVPMALSNIRDKGARILATTAVVLCYCIYIAITVGMQNSNTVLPYRTIF